MYYMLVTQSLTDESRVEFRLVDDHALERKEELDNQNDQRFGSGQWRSQHPYALSGLASPEVQFLDLLVMIDEQSVGGIPMLHILQEFFARGYLRCESLEVAMAQVRQKMSTRANQGAFEIMSAINQLSSNEITMSGLFDKLVAAGRQAGWEKVPVRASH